MRYIKLFLSFVGDVIHNRSLLWKLTKQDFKQRYVGSYLGILWAFIQPAITVAIFWFVFQVGFKSMPVANFPFILWLVCGMFPWFFIADSISSATESIAGNSYLVKKVVFRVSLLPIVKIISALVVHAFFIVLLFLLFFLYGYPPTLYNLQVIYYAFAMVCLILGLSWLTSALVIFLKDVGQLVAMLLQFGFWATPVFWSFKMLPAQYAFFLQLNPACYIVEGYRNCFIYERWFWQDPELTLCYWLLTAGIMFAGAAVFKKMRPHFADVL